MSDPTTNRYWSMVEDAASRHGLDPYELAAQIEVESNWNPTAISRAGAAGLGQIMPGTASELGLEDPFDPASNINATAQYMAKMLKQFGGDKQKAWTAYHSGPGNVAAGTLGPRGKEYAGKIKTVLGGYGRAVGTPDFNPAVAQGGPTDFAASERARAALAEELVRKRIGGPPGELGVEWPEVQPETIYDTTKMPPEVFAALRSQWEGMSKKERRPGIAQHTDPETGQTYAVDKWRGMEQAGYDIPRNASNAMKRLSIFFQAAPQFRDKLQTRAATRQAEAGRGMQEKQRLEGRARTEAELAARNEAIQMNYDRMLESATQQTMNRQLQEQLGMTRPPLDPVMEDYYRSMADRNRAYSGYLEGGGSRGYQDLSKVNPNTLIQRRDELWLNLSELQNAAQQIQGEQGEKGWLKWGIPETLRLQILGEEVEITPEQYDFFLNTWIPDKTREALGEYQRLNEHLQGLGFHAFPLRGDQPPGPGPGETPPPVVPGEAPPAATSEAEGPGLQRPPSPAEASHLGPRRQSPVRKPSELSDQEWDMLGPDDRELYEALLYLEKMGYDVGAASTQAEARRLAGLGAKKPRREMPMGPLGAAPGAYSGLR